MGVLQSYIQQSCAIRVPEFPLASLSLVCWMDVLCVQVLTTLAGNLLAVKSRVGTTEGMLPIAEMALPLFLKCPGLLRYRREKI